MKYNIIINQVKSLEWGLNISEAILFSWIYELPSWADKIIKENETYFYASRCKAVDEIPLLSKKPDTIYRIYKSLVSKNLIKMISIDKKEYINITGKGKQWHDSINSEKNPLLGKFSEKAEINPTDNIYNNKENNNITTTSTTRACEENNNSDENTAYHEELKKNKSVEEMTCMNLHIDPPKYEDKLEEFKRECFSKGTFHQNSQDYRRHFYDWLRINLESENKKEKINGNGNGKIRSEIENRNEKMREAYYRDAERLGIKADPCPF